MYIGWIHLERNSAGWEFSKSLQLAKNSCGATVSPEAASVRAKL